jgi:glycosyltransferase involved in cell wall biosynthesis
MARIAFLLPDFAIGGAERVALTLITAFLERGIEIDLVLVRPEGELLSALPGEVNVVSLGGGRLRSSLRPLIRYLRDQKPDAVQVRMWPLTLLPIAGRRLAGSAARTVVSDDNVLSKAYTDRGRFHRLVLRASIALFYPLADARIAVSEGVAKDLAMLGGLERNSITVLNNPVALPSRHDGSREIDWGGEGLRILAVGCLIPVKNYSLLLRSFAQLTRSRPARLVILGEGQERGQLESLAAKLGIADRVTMPGATTDLSPYYASADVFVLSSHNEGFGNVLVEAMHHGLTVVSTDCPTGPREILEGGRYGYLTPSGDADGLAAAIDHACDHPFAPDVLEARAQALSGPHVIDKYLELLLPGYAR